MTIALNVLYINNGEFFMGIEKKYILPLFQRTTWKTNYGLLYFLNDAKWSRMTLYYSKEMICIFKKSNMKT